MTGVAPFTPIQYLIGTTPFCRLDFEVTEAVLIPRPETEMLVDAAEKHLSSIHAKKGLRILDLCTGSGCIAISLAVRLTKRRINCTIHASDISAEALAVARKNAARNGVQRAVSFAQADLFNGFNGEFDCIVTNPPYIAQHEFAELQKEVLREPHIALDGGQDGCDFYRRIALDAPHFLSPDGLLVAEVGWGQRRTVCELFAANGLAVQDVIKDFNAIDRVITARVKMHG